MGLFDKKYCDVCGEKIGLLGNKKLEDGNLCKDCAAKLSPWFSERKESTVDQIKAQLEYRENNSAELENFNQTRVLGSNWKVFFDDSQRNLFVSNSSSWKSSNPDLIPYDKVTGCTIDIKRNQRAHTQTAAPQGHPGPGPGQGGRPGMPPQSHGGMQQGRPGMQQGRPGMQQGRPGMQQPGRIGANPQNRSGMPMQTRVGMTGGAPAGGGTYYTYDYDFYVTINVNCDWFNEVKFRINSSSVDESNTAQYNNMNYEAEQIRDAINAIAQDNLTNVASSYVPKKPVNCPFCGATTTPDDNGCCEYCGSALNT